MTDMIGRLGARGSAVKTWLPAIELCGPIDLDYPSSILSAEAPEGSAEVREESAAVGAHLGLDSKVFRKFSQLPLAPFKRRRTEWAIWASAPARRPMEHLCALHELFQQNNATWVSVIFACKVMTPLYSSLASPPSGCCSQVADR